MVTQTSPMLPFKGLRVVDMTQGLAGPFCAMLLGHYGATVIKVEPPEGDWSRTLGATKGDRTPAYTTCNRGKQALVVDLKQKAGLEVVLKLAEDCDVFLESNRQGVADRLGIGYEAIRAVSPDVVYGSVTGFGSDAWRDTIQIASSTTLMVFQWHSIPGCSGTRCDAAGPGIGPPYLPAASEAMQQSQKLPGQ